MDGEKVPMFRQRLYPVAVRLRLGLWPIVQTALAASVAWVLAVDYGQSTFAPVDSLR